MSSKSCLFFLWQKGNTEHLLILYFVLRKGWLVFVYTVKQWSLSRSGIKKRFFFKLLAQLPVIAVAVLLHCFFIYFFYFHTERSAAWNKSCNQLGSSSRSWKEWPIWISCTYVQILRNRSDFLKSHMTKFCKSTILHLIFPILVFGSH